MPWPIMTDQIHLDSEKDAANKFLKHKGLPLIKSVEFFDDDDTDSYISVNKGEYYIDWRSETVMMKSIRGEFPHYIYYLRAWQDDDPMDPQEPGGRINIYEESHFGSLSYFLVRMALETVFTEWRNFHHG
jgi:hypothetical protein